MVNKQRPDHSQSLSQNQVVTSQKENNDGFKHHAFWLESINSWTGKGQRVALRGICRVSGWPATEGCHPASDSTTPPSGDFPRGCLHAPDGILRTLPDGVNRRTGSTDRRAYLSKTVHDWRRHGSTAGKLLFIWNSHIPVVA